MSLPTHYDMPPNFRLVTETETPSYPPTLMYLWYPVRRCGPIIDDLVMPSDHTTGRMNIARSLT